MRYHLYRTKHFLLSFKFHYLLMDEWMVVHVKKHIWTVELVLVLLFLFNSASFFNYPSGEISHQNMTYSFNYISGKSVFNVSQSPIIVQYYEDVNVTVTFPENQNISSVALHFRMDYDFWQRKTMTNSTPTLYWEVIPAQPWNTIVQYYINATDQQNQILIEDNNGTFFEYIIADSVKPHVEILSPQSGVLSERNVEFMIQFHDAGSGLDRFEIYIDEILALSGHSNDVTFQWIFNEGMHTVEAFSFDLAGNEGQDSIVISIENVGVFPIHGFSFFTIIIGLVAGIGIGLFLSRRRSYTS